MVIKMVFFDKINNSPIVNTLKKLLHRGDGEIFFMYIPHKKRMLVSHHQRVSMSVLDDNDQLRDYW